MLSTVRSTAGTSRPPYTSVRHKSLTLALHWLSSVSVPNLTQYRTPDQRASDDE